MKLYSFGSEACLQVIYVCAHSPIRTVIFIAQHNAEDDKKMLQDTSFEIGDFLDVAVVARKSRTLRLFLQFS